MIPLPWSHSRLDAFKTCPKQFYHKFVIKDVTDPPNDAGNFGDRVHKAFESYLREGTPLTDEAKHWQSYIDTIKAVPGELHVECKYAIDKQLQPCSFFADTAWCRGIVDTLTIDGGWALAVDHKTGKVKADSDQLTLCALLVFIHHPQVTQVDTKFEWLKVGKTTEQTFTRDQVPDMWQTFVPRLVQYKQAFNEEMFVPKPSGLCKAWCNVLTCEFNGVHKGWGPDSRR